MNESKRNNLNFSIFLQKTKIFGQKHKQTEKCQGEMCVQKKSSIRNKDKKRKRKATQCFVSE